MFLSIQGQSVQTDIVTRIFCEHETLFLFFQNDDLPKLVFYYDTPQDCQKVYQKICDLLDVQPIEAHFGRRSVKPNGIYSTERSGFKA